MSSFQAQFPQFKLGINQKPQDSENICETQPAVPYKSTKLTVQQPDGQQSVPLTQNFALQ